MHWTLLDTWIVVAGALISMACTIPGTYLVLFRNSLFGDAVSHAILPGIAAAFLITGSRETPAMIVGAIIAAILTAVLSDLIHCHGQIEKGASLGIVFTALFALGLILIRLAADHVDLDPDCVLYGTIETAVADFLPIPHLVLVSAVILSANLFLMILFWKEIKLTVFDSQFAEANGIRTLWLRQGVNLFTAITAVVAFESVGSILIIAMLVIPAISAKLLSNRLSHLVILALIVAALSAPIGHLLAVWILPYLASMLLQQNFSAFSTAGSMTMASGLLLGICALIKKSRQRKFFLQ